MIRSMLRRLWRDEKGVTGLEYGLLGFGLSIAIMATVFAIGGELRNMFNATDDKISERLSLFGPSDND